MRQSTVIVIFERNEFLFESKIKPVRSCENLF